MDLRHLENFLAVVDEGSINGAAALRHLSQPALSRQIRSLESTFEIGLLTRTAQGVRPTAAGETLARQSRRILAVAAETHEAIAGSQDIEEVLNIGVPPGTPENWLVAVIHSLQDNLLCRPSILEASSNAQLKRLREGRLDIALVHQSPPRDVDSWLLRRESFGLAVRPGSVLDQEGQMTLADLDDIRVVVHSREQVPTQQDALISAVLRSGAQPEWRFVQFVEHLRAAVESERADAALLSAHSAITRLPDWRFREFGDLDVQMHTWLLALSKARTIVTRAADAIRRMPRQDSPGQSN